MSRTLAKDMTALRAALFVLVVASAARPDLQRCQAANYKTQITKLIAKVFCNANVLLMRA
jgi:flagellar biosynthesis/type III secretory pathway ATPase